MLRSRRQSSMMKVILAILFVTALMVPSGKKCNSHQSDTDSSFFPVQEVITTCAQSGVPQYLSMMIKTFFYRKFQNVANNKTIFRLKTY